MFIDPTRAITSWTLNKTVDKFAETKKTEITQRSLGLALSLGNFIGNIRLYWFRYGCWAYARHMLFLGVLLVIGGFSQLCDAFKAKGWDGVVWHAFIAALYIIGGASSSMIPFLPPP